LGGIGVPAALVRTAVWQSQQSFELSDFGLPQPGHSL
jgi:hypothetical protein